jgi:diadenosine tetraphosphate (Ap4A) HIT family hydrolase
VTIDAWPDDWPARMAGRDCPMCATVGGGDNDHAVDVATLPYTAVGLERRSRLPGYCVVVWRHGHVAEPTDLDPADAAGYWRDVMDVGRAIQAELRPIKLNFLTLGNWVPHLHTHVLPRYRDDPAPGGPIPWEAIFSSAPADHESLRQLADALAVRLGRSSTAER